jgi:hypothetical protein
MSRILLMGLVLLASACASVDPNLKHYDVPAGITPENGGTISGSRVKTTWPMDDQTLYILGVSGQPVRGGKAAYSEPVVVAPGVHRIAIAWVQGDLFGHATVQLEVKPGDRLAFMHQSVDKQVARVWLEDVKTNTPVGEAFFLRKSARSSGGYVPIFIPRGR